MFEAASAFGASGAETPAPPQPPRFRGAVPSLFALSSGFPFVSANTRGVRILCERMVSRWGSPLALGGRGRAGLQFQRKKKKKGQEGAADAKSGLAQGILSGGAPYAGSASREGGQR